MAESLPPAPNLFGRTLLRHRKMLGGLLLFGALLGGLLSYLAPRQYRATAVVYAAGSGDEMRLHQGNTLILQQLFQSSFLRDTLIARHKLCTRYQVPPDQAQSQARTYRALADHLSIERTVFNSLEITATDTNPQFAAQLANSAARLISAAQSELIRENKAGRLKLLASRLKERRFHFDSLLQAFQAQQAQVRKDSLRALKTAEYHLRKKRERRLAQKHQLTRSLGTAQPYALLETLAHSRQELAQRQAALAARYQAAQADSVRQRLNRLRRGTREALQALKKRQQEVLKALLPFQEVEEALRQLDQQLALNRHRQTTLQSQPSLNRAQELAWDRAKEVHQAYLEKLKAYRQGQELLAHPPQAAYLASKAVPPAEPSRPFRLLWALLGGFFLSSTAFLILILRALWKPTA